LNWNHLRNGRWLLILSLLAGTGGIFCRAAHGQDWATQAELCDRKLASKPKDSQVWADLVEARLNLQDTRRAGEALKIWRKNVRDVGRRFPIIERLEGDLAYSNGDLPGSVVSWKHYVRLVPDKTEGWERLAWAQERLSDLPGAIESVSGAIKAGTDPEKQAGRYAWLARLKIGLRDWQGAADALSAGNKLDATNTDIQKLFPKFERSAEWLPRLKVLDAAVQQSSDDAAKTAALLDRSEWLAREAWLEQAFEDAAAAFRKAPKSLRAEVWKGVLAWQCNRPKETGNVARTDMKFWWALYHQWRGADWSTLDVLKQLDKETNPEIRAEGLLNLHQPVLAWREVKDIDGARIKTGVLLALEEIPKAEAAARRAAEVHPDDAEVWIDLAYSEFRNGNVKEALEHLDHAKQVDPKMNIDSRRKDILKTLGTKGAH